MFDFVNVIIGDLEVIPEVTVMVRLAVIFLIVYLVIQLMDIFKRGY